MPQKIAQPPRPSHKTSNISLPKEADPLAGELLQHLADVPALAAAGVLTSMLLDTEDSTTRLAIMRTRIQVLRARTTACQIGQPVAGNITLGEVFAYQASIDQQMPTHEAEPSRPDPKPEADTRPSAEPTDQPVRARLLETYSHAGIELPKGGVFLISPNSAKELAKLGICEVLDEPETPDTGTTAAAKNAPEEPENVE